MWNHKNICCRFDSGFLGEDLSTKQPDAADENKRLFKPAGQFNKNYTLIL
jgi:hypothetical protein